MTSSITLFAWQDTPQHNTCIVGELMSTLLCVLLNPSSPSSIGMVRVDNKKVLKYHVLREHVFRKPNHTTATDGGQGGKAEVLNFKHDSDLRTKKCIYSNSKLINNKNIKNIQ